MARRGSVVDVGAQGWAAITAQRKNASSAPASEYRRPTWLVIRAAFPLTEGLGVALVLTASSVLVDDDRAARTYLTCGTLVTGAAETVAAPDVEAAGSFGRGGGSFASWVLSDASNLSS